MTRMQAAGLLTRDRAAASRREILLVPTESGRRLADWVRDGGARPWDRCWTG